MFKVSPAEVLVFLALTLAAYSVNQNLLEWPTAVVSLLVIIVITSYGWFYARKTFARVILVRGMGVNVFSKDFQTEPMHANPEVWKIISNLRNFHVTALFWSFSQDFEEGVVEHFGLDKFYDKIYYPSDFITADPKEYLAGICKALGVSPKRVVLIDSDEKGMQAGKALGMAVVPYKSPHKLAADLKAAGL